MNPHLIRIGITLAGAMAAKFILVRFASKGFDLRQTLDAISSDLHQATEEIRTKGGEFSSKLEALTEAFTTIQNGQVENLSDMVKQSNEVLAIYHSLPKAVKPIVRATIDLEGSIREMLKQATSLEGWKLLGEKAVPDRSLEEHLQRQYQGIYYLGLTGEQLKDSEIDSICVTLCHFHQQLGRPTDHGLVAWYTTVGVGQKIPLVALLATCSEVIALDVELNVIASVLDKNAERPETDVLEALSVD